MTKIRSYATFKALRKERNSLLIIVGNKIKDYL